MTIGIVKIRMRIDEVSREAQGSVMRGFLSFSILFVLSLSCSAAEGEAPESLPGIFNPLSWEMDLKNVGQLFSKARIIESEHTIQDRSGKFKKAKVVIISDLIWQHLGEVYASVYHQDKKIK